MICPRCGSNDVDGRKFCGDCGSPLPWKCPVCGGENHPEKRFCGGCGTAMEAVPGPAKEPRGASVRPAAAERRMLTIIFIDLVGSTTLGGRMDPEDLREVNAAFQTCVTGLVTRYDGFIARYMGDGVLAYFGYPQAHEDDAERAVRAGLSIVDAVTRLKTIAGPAGTLRTRVGIASGLAVVGDLIGSGSSLESAVVGNTPNLAAHLQAAAEPDTVVISDATRHLVGDLFDYQELMSKSKSLSASDQAWVVAGESAIQSRFEALRPSVSPLIGRTEEMALLLRRWDSAKGGEGRLVLLSGEPGIGKSRLVVELEQEARNTKHRCVRFFCSLHYQDTPLHPVIRQMERAADIDRTDSAVAKHAKLCGLLSAETSTEDIALLDSLLSIPDYSAALPKSLSPQRQKEMTFATIIRQFELVARRRPILVIFEDAHWADPTTLDLLNRFADAVERLPILLVITSRPDGRPSWAARPHVTIQMLNGLDRRPAAQLIKAIPGGSDLPHDVVDRIIDHADGVPLFIEELAKTVLQAGQLGKNDDSSLRLESLSADIVPTSLHASLMARLDRSADSRELAQIGSVIGREFTFETVLALSSLPPTELERAFGELVQAEIISVRGQPPSATYTFKHALVQDAAYASMLRARRRNVHLRLAEQIEKNTPDIANREPELIARHFSEAGVPDRSIHYYLMAAEQTTGRFAIAEMVRHFRNALRQLEFISNSTDTSMLELKLQVGLGRALIDYEGSASEEVRTTFERARELCLALDERLLLPRVYDGLTLNYQFTHSQSDKILYYSREMLELGEKTGNRQAVLMARRGEAQANLLLGHFEQARHAMQLVIDMYDLEHDAPHSGISTRDPKVSICTLLGICLTTMGYSAAGLAMSEEGIRHAENLNHAVSLILGLRRACLQGMVQRNTQAVSMLSKRLIAVGSEYETFKGGREGTLYQDWALLRTQLQPLALDRMQAAIKRLDTAKNWALLPFFMASVAELRGAYGDVEGAAALLDRAEELVRLTGEQWCLPEIMRLQSCFNVSDHNEATKLLRDSISKARNQGAKLWELRASVSLAELWLEQDRRDAAREMLTPLYEWFTEGLDTPDLVAARQVLDRLSHA
jgi:class 3 adenylate cyclase